MDEQMIRLDESYFSAIMSLFIDCFFDDHCYAELFPVRSTRANDMVLSFSEDIRFCLSRGYSFGILDEAGELGAFILVFDYRRCMVEFPEAFRHIFAGNTDVLPYFDQIHRPIRKCDNETLFILSVAVRSDLRRKGLASMMLDRLIREYPGRNIASDVSAPYSIPMYDRRGFEVSEMEPGYSFVFRNGLF